MLLYVFYNYTTILDVLFEDDILTKFNIFPGI